MFMPKRSPSPSASGPVHASLHRPVAVDLGVVGRAAHELEDVVRCRGDVGGLRQSEQREEPACRTSRSRPPCRRRSAARPVTGRPELVVARRPQVVRDRRVPVRPWSAPAGTRRPARHEELAGRGRRPHPGPGSAAAAAASRSEPPPAACSTIAAGSAAACASTYRRTSSRSSPSGGPRRPACVSRSCRCAISRRVAFARCIALFTDGHRHVQGGRGVAPPTSRPRPAGSAPPAVAAAAAGSRSGTPARWSRRPPRRRPDGRVPVPPIRPANRGTVPARRSRRTPAGRAPAPRSRLPGPAAQLVQAGVGGDGVQPGPRRRPPLEAVPPPPRPQHRLLHQVLGLVERAQHPVAVRPQFPAVVFGQFGEGGLVGDVHTRDDDARPPTHRPGRIQGRIGVCRTTW